MRFSKLGSIPPSLNWDEVAIGWNAKTIFHTRRDEYGTRLPLSFKSFGDYKAPVYIYLTAPIVGLLGMNEVSVRLLSATVGIISVGIIYFLVQVIFGNTKDLFIRNKNLLALFSSLLLAITPWHLFLSRPAIEANLALFFILLGIWLFLLGIRRRGFWLIPALLALSLSLYSYHSPKIFVPIFVLGLLVIFRKQLFDKKRVYWFLGAVVFGIMTLLPLIWVTLFSKSALRFQGTSIFYNQEGERRPINLNLASQLGKNYLIHYSPQFLFTGRETNLRVQMKQVGPLLLVEAPFLILGLYLLIKNRRQQWAQFLLWWLLIGPLAAVVGKEIPHPIRALNLLPAVTIIVALGGVSLWQWLERQSREKSLIGKLLLIVVFLTNGLYFGYRYFVVYPIYAAPDWQYGYQQIATIARHYEEEVDKVIITGHYGQPHIFILFYQDRDPQEVFWGGMIKYLYRDINWEADKQLENHLLIGSPKEIPEDAENIVERVNFSNGETVFLIVKT